MPAKRPKESKVNLGDRATDRLLHDTEAILALREAVAEGDCFYLSATADDAVLTYSAIRLPSDREHGRPRTVVGKNFAFVLLELLNRLPEKVCLGCRAELSVTAFGVDLIRPDGIHDYCSSCVRARYQSSKKPVVVNGHPKKARAADR